MILVHRSARKRRQKLQAYVDPGRSATAPSVHGQGSSHVAWPKPQVPAWIDALPLVMVMSLGAALALFLSQEKPAIPAPEEVEMIWEEVKPQPQMEEKPILPPPPPRSEPEPPSLKPAPPAVADPMPSPTVTPEEAQPPEAVFGLTEDALAEQGDMAVATGNTLMTTPGEQVQAPQPPLSPAVAPPDYDGPYLDALREEIMRHYPPKARRLRLEGKVRLRLALDRFGRILKSELIESSGHAILDQGLLESLDQLGAFAPFPPGMNRENWNLEIPVHFHMKVPTRSGS